ncbi:MAG: hypothetical protein LKI53_05035 [Bacteroidales bacterium]|nr:hypothetical protein [Bacteroidales bacterium]
MKRIYLFIKSNDRKGTVFLSEITLEATSGVCFTVFSGKRPLSISPIEFDAIVEPASTDSLSLSISLISDGIPGTLTENFPSEVWEPGYRACNDLKHLNDR